MKGALAGFAIVLLVLGRLALSEDPATDLRKEVGAEIFLSAEGEVVGASIPGNHFGFAPATELPTACQQYFPSDRAHVANAPLDIVLGSRTKFDALKQMTSLKWIKYCGSSNQLDNVQARRASELNRFRALSHTLLGTKGLRAIALFDAVLPADGIVTLLQVETLEIVVLIRCEAELANGVYTSLPETQMKLRGTCGQK